jgi:hypothetical protein
MRIGPGTIMTELLEDVLTDEDARQRMLSRTPMGGSASRQRSPQLRPFLPAISPATSPARPSMPMADGSGSITPFRSERDKAAGI